MIIKLITEDFKGSDYNNPWGCPLTNAMKRYLTSGERLSTGSDYTRVDGNPYYFNLEQWNSDIIEPLINKANNGEEVSYELDIPELELN